MMEFAIWTAVAVQFLLLHSLPCCQSTCPLYGCTSSLSFTCPTDFYPSSSNLSKALFYPHLAAIYKVVQIAPTGVGCVTNVGKIYCPFTGNGTDSLLSWDINSQYAWWNYTMKTVVTLPVISDIGQLFVTDGNSLCFQPDKNPVGSCIEQKPITGPVFDLTVVSKQYLYMLYKCGFMVAYFIFDGTAFASIWLNTTINGLDGTFIPLGNPAVSGERVYIITAFKPNQQVSMHALHLKLYAIDVRSIIKVTWSYDLFLRGANLPYLTSKVTECVGRSDPMEPLVGSVLFEEGSRTVVAVVNYFGPGPKSELDSTDPSSSSMRSVMISLTDNGDSYSVNFGKLPMPAPFQSVAYASPNFTVSECDNSSPLVDGKGLPLPPPQAPSMWISRFKSGSRETLIEKINILTGSTIQDMEKIEELQSITVTSRLALFYNDKQLRKFYCNGDRPEDPTDSPLLPLMFGYQDRKDSTNYLGAVDVSGEQPEFLWKYKSYDPIVGQITTVGKDRDTVMALTTTHGALFFKLFAEKEEH